ncbi:hypothetical protein BKA70DRAFT_1425564 [Coprinopsis sp. MPI-PUGE-AT-0042]|nr:hypothetical protein BKA70DRAFT_1425564 [Coprinopsis sp. MPI-PUGE-AT-0042]
MPRDSVPLERLASSRSFNNPNVAASRSEQRGRPIRHLTRSATRALQLSAPPLPKRRVSATTPRNPDRDGPAERSDCKVEPPAEPAAPGLVQGYTEAQRSVRRDEVKGLAEDLKRTKRALESKKTMLRNAREELAVAKEELGEKQGEIESLTERLEGASASKEQYRSWWINEVQFTKVILSKVPNANQDWDLVRTSQSHYLGRY